MHLPANTFGFFHWVGISHYLNLLPLAFLIRQGGTREDVQFYGVEAGI